MSVDLSEDQIPAFPNSGGFGYRRVGRQIRRSASVSLICRSR